MVYRSIFFLGQNGAPSICHVMKYLVGTSTAAPGSLPPSVYARWDGVQSGIPYHVEHRGGRETWEKSDPWSSYCGL